MKIYEIIKELIDTTSLEGDIEIDTNDIISLKNENVTIL